MDEEELLKRFTDCVYFLASPLTCKKGIECDYRHSEIARLNPRDCWYWVGGCCYNPDCPFRHPPLEGFKEAHGELSNPDNGPALPLNKKNVPCYFYSNGYCNKGERCLFLHGPADGSAACKFSKAASTENNTIPCEKKLPTGSDTESAPVESHPHPSETAQIRHIHTDSKPTLDSQQLGFASPERSESPDISATQSRENEVRSDPFLPLEEFVQSESDVYDQSSDQQVDGYVERKGWLESSPGFDVLVEGESEQVGYEGDADYFSVHEEDDREVDVDYAECGYTNPLEYDPSHPELGNSLIDNRYDVYDRLDNKQARESIFYRLSFRKMNSQDEPIFNSRRGSDLREHLKKRKVADDTFQRCFSKGHDPPRLIDHRIRRNPPRHGSHGEIDIDHRGRPWKTVHLNRYRQSVKDKRPGKPQFLEVSRSKKPAFQQKRKSQEKSSIFTGPKTLDQIKEEKKKALENSDHPIIPGLCNGTESDGFQGPRPLSEILKNKRKLV